MIIAGAALAVACSAVCITPVTTEKIEEHYGHAEQEKPQQSAHSHTTEPVEQVEQVNQATVWDRLADCESGEWNRNSNPIHGTANWASTEHRTFQGGLQFHPDTWRAFKPEGFPNAAYNATREQQIQVGVRVQAQQGWKAWPTCSRKLGLR